MPEPLGKEVGRKLKAAFLVDETCKLSVHLSGLSFNTGRQQVRGVQTQVNASQAILRELMWNICHTL